VSILTSLLGKLTKGVDLNQMAQKTKGWTGADLHGLIREACFVALSRGRSAPDPRDIQDALESNFPGESFSKKKRR
jgi:ATP-dependent 26S proteasome regulatory subunit